MTRMFRRIATLTAAALGLGAAHTAQAQIAYGIAGNGTTLVSFNLATPGVTTFIGNLSGATTFLNDIDFRAANGLLYGYSQPTNQIVTINTATAVTTFAAAPATGVSLDFVAADFDSATDRLRLVSPNGQNLSVDPGNGATTTGGTLTYAAGDIHAGATPFISDAASSSNAAYYLDSQLGDLVTSSNSDSGVLNTVGSLGVVSSNQGGFDIYTGSGGINSAFALLDDGPNAGLYSINLSTGAASLVGDINASGSFFGFAIDPRSSPAAVPEPGSLALFAGMAVTGAGLLFRKRRRTGRKSA